MMFEAEELGTIDMSQDTKMLSDALNGISLFQDKNFNKGDAITDFWTQKKSKDGQFWYQSPTNMVESVSGSQVDLLFQRHPLFLDKIY